MQPPCSATRAGGAFWSTNRSRRHIAGSEIIVADIDLDYADALKNRLGNLTNRREGVYTLCQK